MQKSAYQYIKTWMMESAARKRMEEAISSLESLRKMLEADAKSQLEALNELSYLLSEGLLPEEYRSLIVPLLLLEEKDTRLPPDVGRLLHPVATKLLTMNLEPIPALLNSLSSDKVIPLIHGIYHLQFNVGVSMKGSRGKLDFCLIAYLPTLLKSSNADVVYEALNMREGMFKNPNEAEVTALAARDETKAEVPNLLQRRDELITSMVLRNLKSLEMGELTEQLERALLHIVETGSPWLVNIAITEAVEYFYLIGEETDEILKRRAEKESAFKDVWFNFITAIKQYMKHGGH